ncbi:hypothetical protein [Bizionia arctica]|uniref:TraB/GumN family protein n=1 Tax=Bizionia arctica TaxID=1495645 RepID=A0A917LNE1_9FLAO|nr:hypothetical protein [Bizionia arctica]GGG46761.1 hypothetical protein GCM10010976_17750 [Bizionia arctica]
MNFKIKWTLNFFLILILLCIISCNSIRLKSSGVLDEKIKIETLTNRNKKVAFLPIQHIGKIKYYDDVSKKIDSLQKLNYVAFYESVSTELTDSAAIDLLDRKYRKIVGNLQAKSGYLDTINNKLYGNIDNDKKHNLINQPDYDKMNLDTLKAVNADVTFEKLINDFEDKNGLIKLDECDFKTHIDSTYNCQTLSNKMQKNFRKDFVLGLRNKYLAKLINNSDSTEILVIYGSAHFKGLVSELKKIDSNWKYEK